MTELTDARMNKHRQRRVTFLPEPQPRERLYTVISVDDHLVEPPDMFEGRMPAKFAELAPKVVEQPDGSVRWIYNGKQFPNIGLNA
ncbi:MAG: amidohydrolase family protein, partial [Mycobacterium sp.]